MALTQQEAQFVEYWKDARLQKRKLFRNILVGLPLGLIIVAAVFINFFSGWYKRASMVANADPSLFIILLVAGIFIVAFIAIFSSYHKWDINENRYQELISRKD